VQNVISVETDSRSGVVQSLCWSYFEVALICRSHDKWDLVFHGVSEHWTCWLDFDRWPILERQDVADIKVLLLLRCLFKPGRKGIFFFFCSEGKVALSTALPVFCPGKLCSHICELQVSTRCCRVKSCP
jgi:hypothetical protein